MGSQRGSWLSAWSPHQHTGTAESSDTAAVEWPYMSSQHSAASAADQPEQWIDLMQAFGATRGQAVSALSFDSFEAVDRGMEVPDVLTGAEPIRIETATSSDLSAEIAVFDDGTLRLSLMQTREIASGAEPILDFDSARVDFSEITDYLAVGLADSEPTITGISGCDSLPSANGWTRRADCFMYDSSTPPLISGSAYLDYSVRSGGGRIDGITHNDANCGPTVAASGSANIHRRLNVGSTPARGINTINCSFPTGGQTFTQNAWAYGSAWTTHNF